MAYASRLGRARVNARSPQAAAICQRCGFVYNRVDIRYQYDWTGTSLQNLRVLVCDRCYDEPQEQARSIVIPADPVPVVNPSPEFYTLDETSYPTLTPGATNYPTGLPVPNATRMTTVSGDDMITQPVGRPKGYTQNAQMPIPYGGSFNSDFNNDFDTGNFYAQILPVVAIISAGTCAVTVTTAYPNSLVTGSQASVEGVLNRNAAGSYSVTVTSFTQFTYQTDTAIPAGSLLLPHTLVKTMNIGVPRTMSQLPQTGP